MSITTDLRNADNLRRYHSRRKSQRWLGRDFVGCVTARPDIGAWVTVRLCAIAILYVLAHVVTFIIGRMFT